MCKLGVPAARWFNDTALRLLLFPSTVMKSYQSDVVIQLNRVTLFGLLGRKLFQKCDSATRVRVRVLVGLGYLAYGVQSIQPIVSRQSYYYTLLQSSLRVLANTQGGDGGSCLAVLCSGCVILVNQLALQYISFCIFFFFYYKLAQLASTLYTIDQHCFHIRLRLQLAARRSGKVSNIIYG